MNDADRYRLHHGPSTTPRVRTGGTLRCEFRGAVIVTGLTDAPIRWPVGRRAGKGTRARTLVVYGRLADAIRRESNQAAFWWGVTAQTVTKWRKALGVEPTTEGTSRLRSAYAHEPAAVRARSKAHAKADDPERCAKIAASKRGRPRPRASSGRSGGRTWG